jgi:hypothetical protein
MGKKTAVKGRENHGSKQEELIMEKRDEKH